MTLQRKIKQLQAYRSAARRETKGMIQHLLDLYSAQKIPNIRTVENAVSRLSLKTKHKGIVAKVLSEYEAITAKYKDALPTTGRIELQVQEKRKRPGTSLTLMLFRRASTGDAEATVNVEGFGGAKAEEQVREMGAQALKEIKNQTNKTKIKYGGL